MLADAASRISCSCFRPVLAESEVVPSARLVRSGRSSSRRDDAQPTELLTDSVEKFPGALGLAHHSSIYETIFSPSCTFLTAVPVRHRRSYNAGGWRATGILVD